MTACRCAPSSRCGRCDEPVDSLSMVREFHERFGQPVHDEPHIGDRELSRLRIKLLAEELCELAEALGFRYEFTEIAEGLPTDEVEALDALGDLTYVVEGAFLSLGYHRMKNEALAEIHRSNLSKLGEDGKPVLRVDGKVIKGPAFSPPDLASIVKRHGEEK